VVAVTVTGAVVMPGTVRMLRSDASVFSAIAQCGGGRANAGKQISVTRNMSATNAPKSAPDGTGTGDVAERAVIRGQSPADAAPAAPVQPSAPVQTPASAVPAITTTASPTAVADAKPVESAPPPNTESPPDIANQALTDSPPTDSSLADRGGNGRDAVATPRVEWFHLDRDEDVAALKKLNLEDGDILHITETALPVRVMGHVTRSGPVQVPGDRRLSVWDVVEQAGGIRTNAWPVGVTLYRPTSETGRASQFSWTLESAESARPPTEFLRPGDVVYVAPSAGARLKNAVGGLLRK
jgi:protein involved in polysaccharide export with SLBB domain